MSLEQDATEVLRQTSRTFFISIMNLPSPLREALTSAYLSFRAIDEIEDHPHLDRMTKICLLSDIGNLFQTDICPSARTLSGILRAHRDELPEVTSRLDEWTQLAPCGIGPQIWDAAAAMARRMIYWAANNWSIRTREDLDCYGFCVAGTVGVLLSDLWVWYDGTHTERGDAISFGRGLQAVNILRNRPDDLARGVDFFPTRWNEEDLSDYAKYNLARGKAYVDALPQGAIKTFCRTPLDLAYGTLDALALGEAKLSRSVVLEIVKGDENLVFVDT